MTFTFADFELDAARFELRRDGVPVAVQPKVLRLLLVLVEQRERALSEDELMRALWPSETVSRASIKRAVMGARIALADRGATFIRTVRGHGYQFVHPVCCGDPSPVEVATPLRELESALRSALRGEGGMVLLRGGAGLGKTRLLHELAQRARKLDVHVWWGHCLELDGAPPFWPLTQVLRMAALAVPELPPSPALAGLVRGDLEETDSSRSTVHARGLQLRLYDDLATYLLQLAGTRPVLCLLDDLHRADEPTLQFLGYLAGLLGSSHLLVVASTRPGERATAMAGISTARALTLRGLDAKEVGQLAQTRLGHALAPDLLAALHEQTAGNPLFIEELLRALALRGGTLDRAALSGLGAEAGLLGAIERHLGLLPAASRHVLALASVLGREFSLARLAQLAATPSDELAACLDDAVAAEILLRSSHDPDLHRFQHVLIRDVLYDGMEATARARVHLRAAQLLEAADAEHGSDRELSELAEHYRLAASVAGVDSGIRYACAAGERARLRHAHEESAVHLGRALALLSSQAARTHERSRLTLALAEAQLRAGEAELGRATLTRAVALARSIGALDVLADAARLLGRARESGEVDEQRVSLLREALALLPERDERVPVLRAMLAKSLNFTSAHEERAQLARRALTESEALPEASRAEVWIACHEALTHPETRPERLHIARGLTHLAREGRDPNLLLAAATTRFENALEHGQLPVMREVVDELHWLAQRVRDPFVHWSQHAYRATTAVLAGRFAEGEASARAAWQLGKLVGEDLARHFYCVQVGGMLRMQGRLAEAEAMAREMCARFPLAGWRAWHACLQLDLGMDVGSALHELVDGGLASVRRDPYWLGALCPVAELCVRIGNVAIARELYQVLQPFADWHGNVSFGGASYGPVSLPLARLASCMGQLDDAVRHAEAALREAERMQSPPYRVWAGLTLAATHRACGRDVRALVIAAQDLAVELGMHAVLPLCTRLLSRSGAPAAAAR